MEKNWRIGCSGFHYKEWKERFYPKGLAQKHWFTYYTEHFNTLELNVTFYRFPELKALLQWHTAAPHDFLFSAKVPRTVTHYKKFVDCRQVVYDFYQVLRAGLQEKLGAVLFQLPPSFSYTPERLESVLEHIDPAFTNVIEFRHESWWRPDVQQRLTEARVSFCGVSFPKISRQEAVINTDTAYYRFHGVPVLFHSEYDEAFVQDIVNQLRASSAETVYIYFNNTASMAAIANARQALAHLQPTP